MSQTARMIEYAPDGLVLPADRLLRRIVALMAMLYGGSALAGAGLHIALARGWAASPRNMSWTLSGGFGGALFIARIIMMGAWVVAGLLLLRGARAGVILMRLSAAATVVMLAAAEWFTLATIPDTRSYWSTPAAAAENALQYLNNLYVPALLVLLTLPPLVRRMK
jgi:hypothetical protein